MILQLIAGFVLLLLGGELLVRSASRLAALLGMSPLIIGLTVVAFGTSAPELFASLVASLEGRGDIALGNVVGSNIFNVLGILGLSAAIAPIAVALKIIRVEIPLMIAVSLLTLVLGLDGSISRLDGVLLFGLFVTYMWFTVRAGKQEAGEAAKAGEANEANGASEANGANEAGKAELAANKSGLGLFYQILLLLTSLGLLVFGSKFLVDGASSAARAMGVSELIIGLTVVALGTSLPEVATSVLAALRGERDIAVGNIVGSNMFNLLCVLGAASALSPKGISVPDSALRFDIPVMLAAAVACLPIAFVGSRVTRLEGVLLLLYEAAYIGFLVLDATRHDQLEAFSQVMLFFFVPLTVIFLSVGVVQQIRRRRS